MRLPLPPRRSSTTPWPQSGHGPNFFSILAMPLHSGYLEQPRNGPNRPRLTDMGAPHSGHFCVSAYFCNSFSSGSKMTLPLHSGYRAQAPNLPKRPNLATIGPPQIGHKSLMGSVTFSRVSFLASSFSEKGL